MKNIILLLGILGPNVFFSVLAIIGFSYGGVEESNLYVIYVLLISLLNIFIFIESTIKQKKFGVRDIIMIFVPITFLLSFLISYVQYSGLNQSSVNSFIYFVIWGVTSIFIGIVVNKEKRILELYKYVELFMIVFTTSIFIALILNTVQGSTEIVFGGGTYQTASYLSAFSYGLNLYFIFWGNEYKRFTFTKSSFYKTIQKIMVFIQILGVFISGGRGGLVLLFVYSLYFAFQMLKVRDVQKRISFIVMGVSMLGIFLLLLPQLLSNPFFEARFNRSFEFFSISNGINWEGTSNRNSLYPQVIDLISQKPIFGYGIFGYWNKIANPHNIILEVLLAGGIFYFVLCIILTVVFIKKLNKMTKYNTIYRMIVILTIYPLTNLMFSGTYMFSTEFWFVVSLVFTYKGKTIKS